MSYKYTFTNPVEFALYYAIPAFVVYALAFMLGIPILSAPVLIALCFTSVFVVFFRLFTEKKLAAFLGKSNNFTFYAFYATMNALLSTVAMNLVFVG